MEREYTKEEFKIAGMSCESCLRTISMALNAMPIENVKVEIGQAEVTYDAMKLSRRQIELAIRDVGYQVIK